MAESALAENPYLADWQGPWLPLVSEDSPPPDLEQRLIAEHLPGLSTADSRARFIRELERSAHGINTRRRIAADPGVVDVREPRDSDRSWSPLPAIVQWARGGDRDEATWLAYLATFFGMDERRGRECWRSTLVVYGGFGDGHLGWSRVATDPDLVLELCRRHRDVYATLARGNHRKREPTKDPAHRQGLAASVRSLVALAEHHGGLECLLADADASSRDRFARLMRELAPIVSFGRTGCFDLLVLLGGLGVYELDAPRLYLAGATGPKDGARLMLPGVRRLRNLDDELCAVAGRVGVEIQAMEDALCNWQKKGR
jgi:Alpha-glutamyl/putrescinyl thymine pyrophosphorylase clade 3